MTFFYLIRIAVTVRTLILC